MANFNPGTYLATITEQGWEETKKEPKRDMIVFKMRVTHQVVADAEGNETYPDVSHRCDFEQRISILLDDQNPDSIEWATRKLRAAGFTGTSIGQLDLVGKEIRVRNNPKASQEGGKVFDQWDICLPEKPMVAIDSKKARSLDAKFGNLLKATAPLKAAKAPEPAQETVPPDDDEVPF